MVSDWSVYVEKGGEGTEGKEKESRGGGRVNGRNRGIRAF